ncbi:nuclear transport factor 2 family protein [Pantoea ananatis]|uniref:nuclear transport factor 2 family protein n=1 Tax=Pantoea ananas TaxID=553 RepID=UPI001C897037|nr:nuclear transport factor 2 family protein [Pantoea ananatis]QZE27493.1 nuclear transport factor 2 family protein [Pantoea ananatis]
MTLKTDYFPELTTLVRQALYQHLRPETPTLLSMMSDDILFEFPYALPGSVPSIKGKSALAAHLAQIAGLISLESMTLHNTVIDPYAKRAVLEISCRGIAPETGNRYDQQYVCVLTLQDGLISHWHDYWNPLIVLNALGQQTNTGENS